MEEVAVFVLAAKQQSFGTYLEEVFCRLLSISLDVVVYFTAGLGKAVSLHTLLPILTCPDIISFVEK